MADTAPPPRGYAAGDDRAQCDWGGLIMIDMPLSSQDAKFLQVFTRTAVTKGVILPSGRYMSQDEIDEWTKTVTGRSAPVSDRFWSWDYPSKNPWQRVFDQRNLIVTPLIVRREPRYVQARSDNLLLGLLPMWNLDGVVWHQAPAPRRWHQHWAQTVAVTDGEEHYRCACGAHSGLGSTSWVRLGTMRVRPRRRRGRKGLA